MNSALSPSQSPPSDYVYVFVRQDIPIKQQVVQSNHASLSMGSRYGIEGTPNIVLIGVPDLPALRETCELLSLSRIPHFNWHEPDFDMGFSAIATAPISGEQRRPLAHYKLWSPVVTGDVTDSLSIHASSNGRTADSNSVNRGSTPLA